MIFEDAHWTDPTTLEAFGRIVDRIRTLLCAATCHVQARVCSALDRASARHPPDDQSEWPSVISMPLSTSSRKTSQLPKSVRKDIIERTDGIPLFIEEMTKAILEAESEGAAKHLAASVPSSAHAVPASLHASLMARLDRLGSAKDVAQIGAAVGREFSHPLLAAVAGKSAADLAAALDRLIASGLLFRQGVPPQATYLFKHALVQDAAYGTLLREARRGLHARIAKVLEDQFTEVADNQPELLARHCAEAGLTRGRRGCGARRVNVHWSVRRWLRQWSSSPEPSA